MRINGVDMPLVRMGSGFRDELLSPVPLKEFVSNTSRLEHGDRVIPLNPKLSKRNLTLEFQIVGRDSGEFHIARDLFLAHLYSGVFVLSGLGFTTDEFNLVYTGKSATYSSGLSDCACKIKATFEEPNPGERIHLESYEREIIVDYDNGDKHYVDGDTLVIEIS